MSKLMVILLFAGLTVAKAWNNPIVPYYELFKNGDIPSHDALNKVIDEIVVICQKTFANGSKLPDIRRKFVEENGHYVELLITNGNLTGIESIFRNGDATLTYNDSSILQKTVYGYVFTFNFDYEVTYKGDTVKGKLVAENVGYNGYIDFLINRNTLKIDHDNVEMERTSPVNINLVKSEDFEETRILDASVNVFKKMLEESLTLWIKKILIIEARYFTREYVH